MPDDKDLLILKVNGFEISLATSLRKFGGSSSIPCAFLRRRFLKHLQISDGVTSEMKTFGLFVSVSSSVYSIQSPFIGCRV